MIICGIKVAHDGGVAVLDDNRLLFSVEAEKLGNGRRYSSLGDLDRVTSILASEGLTVSDVDRFVVDGWTNMRVGDPLVTISTRHGDRPVTIRVAPYEDGPNTGFPIERFTFGDHDFGPSVGYASYHHVSNHLVGAYCSSPFARRGEDAMVMVWDGGVFPRIFHVEASTRTASTVVLGLPIVGTAFADFSAEFEPFRTDTSGFSVDEDIRYRLSIAGKAMAYAALGSVTEPAFEVFDLVASWTGMSHDDDNIKRFARQCALHRHELLPGLSDADLIATFQAYLGNRLLTHLTALLRRPLPWQRPSRPQDGSGPDRPNLAIAGGCGLNIKWNSLLRDSGLFSEIWVPPFANDSGAAIGTACCELFHQGRPLALDWNVYSGPGLAASAVPASWTSRPCDERQLAELLHVTGEPVVVLSGRAELGPRALGNRSILAPATDPAMKDHLNAIKDRAPYRPVAPICLTSRAADVFDPGSSDPYMLFEHHLRPGWAERIPAIVHLDGTARLQTIEPGDGSVTGRILHHYAELSGIPVLCNTSANLNGCGFFPDVASAAAWGGTGYIWSEQRLYLNPAPRTPLAVRPVRAAVS